MMILLRESIRTKHTGALLVASHETSLEADPETNGFSCLVNAIYNKITTQKQELNPSEMWQNFYIWEQP
jgi:hypothetical protein